MADKQAFVEVENCNIEDIADIGNITYWNCKNPPKLQYVPDISRKNLT